MLFVLDKFSKNCIANSINRQKFVKYTHLISYSSDFNKIVNFFKLINNWVLKYMKILVILDICLTSYIFIFFQSKLYMSKKNNLSKKDLSILLVLTFKALHLRANYYDLVNYVFQYYSIGILLNMLKLESKSVRHSLKGIKLLFGFLSKKFIKKNYKVNSLIKFNGLSKNYLKMFYMLSNLVNILNVKIFMFNPIKSWNKLKIKKVKSIKRRIKKKLIKFEQKI